MKRLHAVLLVMVCLLAPLSEPLEVQASELPSHLSAHVLSDFHRALPHDASRRLPEPAPLVLPPNLSWHGETPRPCRTQVEHDREPSCDPTSPRDPPR